MGGWRRAEVVACGSRSLCTAACSPFLMPRARRWTGKERRARGVKAGWRRVREVTGVALASRFSAKLVGQSIGCFGDSENRRESRRWHKHGRGARLPPPGFLVPCVPLAYPCVPRAEIDSRPLADTAGTRYVNFAVKKARPLFLILGRDDGVERVRLHPSARSRRGRRATRSGSRVVDEHLGSALVEFRSSLAEQRCLGGARFLFHRESRRYIFASRHITGSPFTLEHSTRSNRS